ncbi:MAG: cryptochrome/photolyase family protein [Cyclobacteriaceae bacterium]
MVDEIVIFWFRRDLRLEDNTGLYYALASGKQVLPIFIFDTTILSKLHSKEDARVGFIHDQISNLQERLHVAGGSVQVEHGEPVEVISKLIEDYPVASIYANRDYEPYGKSRDLLVSEVCKSKGVEFFTFKDQVIFEEGEILTDQGQPYKVFTPFKNRWLKQFQKLQLSAFESENLLSGLQKDIKHSIPTLEQIGFTKSQISIPEKEFPIKIIEDYDAKRNFPAINGTSRLGIHLRHGTISVRQAVAIGLAHSDTWLNELIWREFYTMIIAHFPQVVDCAFKPQYDRIPWKADEESFDAWCSGMTGYPIVDAGMRELVSTGHMHNRIRMITSSFLTKHLLIDWRWGEAFFARHLLDFELSSNNGGWQWASGTGTDAQPYFRVFNPASQTEKFDKNREYIKKWLPEVSTDKYPKPIIEHSFARNRAIQTYKEALG